MDDSFIGEMSSGDAPARDRLSLPGLRSFEVALWLITILCFSTLLFAAIAGARARHSARNITPAAAPGLTSVLSSTGVSSLFPVAQSSFTPDAGQEEAGQVIGRIEIPALKLSAPITSGIETSSLLGGVGHVNGSAVPGGLGTIVLAGHRDTFLRPLKDIGRGMEIVLTDRTGAYRYSVDRWEIVSPEDVDAISVRVRPELALVTCYPFHFVGPAPKRFIVHAHLISLVANQLR